MNAPKYLYFLLNDSEVRRRRQGEEQVNFGVCKGMFHIHPLSSKKRNIYQQGKRPYYVFKLRKTARVREAISKVKEEQWQGVASFGALQIAETRLKLHGWSTERRAVVGCRLISKKSPEESMSLFVRFFNPQKHEEAKTSRKDFMLIASQYGESGRERSLQLSVSQDLWDKIQTGYSRLKVWLRVTAPQLKIESWYGGWAMCFLNATAPQNIKLLEFNCGF